MTKRSGLTVGSATTPLRLLSPIAVILVALFGLSASAASASTLPHAQARIAAERACLTVIHAWALGECARTTNESYDHPEIGWPGVGYAYDLRLHDASAQSRADSGLTSPATAHAERGPRVQVNDSRLRLAAEGEGTAADEVAASTGRTEASNLSEQLAMESAQADPGAGRVLPITMTDARWPASEGWVKMAQNISGVEIHYLYNTVTGASADFKFVP